ncbi:MAG TPA: hypothetical protein PKD05_12110 [Candidatus Melainabacteria bacterium]|nr:hypothetical protein [Candidatus Melainabacteria bacterium]
MNIELQKESDKAAARGKVHWRKSVPLKKRLICFVIMSVSLSFLYYLILERPLSVTAGGAHILQIDKPGSYVLFFTGDLKDPFGWQINNGWIRKSLKVDIEPLDEGGRVKPVESFKDLSQTNLFSIAEYEIFTPGRYLLTVVWEDETKRCQGHMFLEKDVVEKFCYKWAAGIVALIALLAILGFPIGPDS